MGKYGFERKSDIVSIVGFARSSRGIAPWNNPKIDFVGLNEELAWAEWSDNKDIDRRWWKQKPENVAMWFQLHNRSTFSRGSNHNDPNHWNWLQEKHPFPIFMQEKFKDVPSSVAFPIRDIQNEFRTPDGRIYFTSSIAYIMGFMYMLGYKRMELYGFEMASDTEYAFQRPCASWMAGRLRARGMDVYTPPASNFLAGKIYAYEDNWVGWRQDMETTKIKIASDQKKLNNEIDKKRGMLIALTDVIRNHQAIATEASEMVNNLTDEIDNMETKSDAMIGRYDGLGFSTKLHDAFGNMGKDADLPLPVKEQEATNV